MSSPALWALSQDGLTRTEKHVLAVLGIRADSQSWKCFPGVERLSSDTGLERKTIMSATKKLEAKGLIAIQRRRRQSNIYTLLRYQEVPSKGTSRDSQEVPLCGTSNRNQEIPKTDLEVPFSPVRSPPHGTLTRSNCKTSNFKVRGKKQSTRETTLEEDLSDYSWAIVS